MESGLYGPFAFDAAGLRPPASRATDDGIVLVGESLGKPAVRWWGTAPVLAPEFAADLAKVPRGGMAEWHALRIDARVPWIGIDADEKTLPLEVGLDDACDPDKGCYPGQEIVARIRTYGHVNRLLCRLRSDALEDLPEAGTLLFDEDIEAGRWTSSYRVPGGRGRRRARDAAACPREEGQ